MGTAPRLRLPWTASTATTAVECVTGSWTHDERRVTLALRGAGQVCASGGADTHLLEALAACTAHLDALGDEQFRVKELRAHVRRVVASATPPDLLDLSLLVDGDSWAGSARRAAGAAPAEVAAPLVRLLGGLGPRKPSATWLREVASALSTPEAREMLRSWISVAAEAEVVPALANSDLPYCPGALFVGTNTDLVRAAVWATSRVGDDPWPVAQLGVLARRGAAHNGSAGFPEALSIKVATAAVDVLIARGGEAERRVLGELLEDLQRRDLLTKIGRFLGREAEVAARQAELVAQRAREQRRKASRSSAKSRSAMDSLLRQHFGPVLRDLGFGGGPRTWRRVHEDRVDVIHLGAGLDRGTGNNGFDLTYGARFAVAEEPDPGPARADSLDLELFDTAHHAVDPDADGPEDGLSEAGVATMSRRLREVVVPFLDSLVRYETARAAIENGVGVPDETHQHAGLETCARWEVLGRLALAHRDRATAEHYLGLALDFRRRELDLADVFRDWKATQVARLIHLLDRARLLP